MSHFIDIHTDAAMPHSKEYEQFFPKEAQDVADYLEEFPTETYELRLYINKKSPRSKRVIQRVQQFCDDQLSGRYRLSVVDIYESPEMLMQDQIFAVPTLVKRLPPPPKWLIGDMSDMDIQKLVY